MKKKTIVVHNPNNLPTMPYTGFVDFQGDLKDPMSLEEHKKIRDSLLKHGVFVPTFVWFDEKECPNILDGHQRKVVFASLEEDGYEIPEIPYVKVHASSRQDAAEKLLQINSRYAAMNPYANWFEDIGFSDIDEVLGAVNIPELSDKWTESVDASLHTEKEEEPYSRKVEAPIYEIRGEKPNIDDLLNTEKADKLIEKIEACQLSEEEKIFLIRAAYRHDVFDYGRIAEYYAHSEKEIQEHFEESTLIIIDFDKAIEQGYSLLSKEIEAQYRENYPDNET